MLRVITLILTLGFLVSCAHDHESTQDQTATQTSCAAGDCAKNLNKLGASTAEETPTEAVKAAPKIQKKHSKKPKSHH